MLLVHSTNAVHKKRSLTRRLTEVRAAVILLLAAAPAMADSAAISGESTTLFRMHETVDKKNLYPAYEYLRLSATNLGKGGDISLYFGGWGRTDLGDKSTGKYLDGDLQYGYLSYRGKKNNMAINVGRQFVTEGVATERVDGMYFRSDLVAGFGAAAYVGAPVITEPDSKAGDLIYGGRISHGLPKYYVLGASALKSDRGSTRYREEEGIDLWLHPFKKFDVIGRSSYNSLTSGWMEHAYTATYTPIDSIKINAGLSDINCKDYYFHVTTTVFSLITPSNPGGIIDPNEKMLTLGGSVAYTPTKQLTLVADYKNYAYKIAGDANYYGGKMTFSLPESFVAGAAVHRMDGSTDKLRYSEYRTFASKRFQKVGLSVDFIDVHYDSPYNGVRNSYTVAGAASYEFMPGLKLAADIDYSKNPDFSNEVAGLIKLSYAFNITPGSEGKAKSEK